MDCLVIREDVCNRTKHETAISELKQDIKICKIVGSKNANINTQKVCMHKESVPKCSTSLLEVQVGVQKTGLYGQFQVFHFATAMRCELLSN